MEKIPKVKRCSQRKIGLILQGVLSIYKCKLVRLTAFFRSLQAANVSDIIRFHSSFLDSCGVECFLTDERLVKNMDDILKLCLSVASQAENEVNANIVKKDNKLI